MKEKCICNYLLSFSIYCASCVAQALLFKSHIGMMFPYLEHIPIPVFQKIPTYHLPMVSYVIYFNDNSSTHGAPKHKPVWRSGNASHL